MKTNPTIRIIVFVSLMLLQFIFTKTHAQEFTPVKTIETKNIWFFTTDRLGNLYVADDKVISKYNQHGNFLCSYSDYDFLNFKIIDATDPFKLMLFSPEFQSIRLLDSYFGSSGEIFLYNYPNMGLPFLACATDDGNFWIYDRQNNLLKKIDSRSNVMITSSNLYLLSERNYIPVSMNASAGWVVMNNAEEEVLIFDRFGNYFKGVKIDSAYFQQVNERELFFIKNGELIAFDFTLMKQTTVKTPDLTDVAAIRIEQHRIYLFKNGRIEIVAY